MMKTLITLLLLCIFITGCTPIQSADILVSNSEKPVKMEDAIITVRPTSGNPADGPDNTPTCPPVDTIRDRVDSPNPYLKGEVYAPVEMYYIEQPSKHFTPWHSEYSTD